MGFGFGFGLGLSKNSGHPPITSVLSSAQYFWDATDARSFNGTESNGWVDLVNGVVLDLGTNNTVEASDPTFTGTVGNRDAYFNFTTGDTFTIRGGNTAFINALQKTTGGQDHSQFGVIYLDDHTASQIISSTRTGTSPGVTVQWSSTETLQYLQRGGTALSTATSTTTNLANGWYFFVVSHQQSSNNTYMSISSLSENVSHTFNATTSDASLALNIGQTLTSGNRVKCYGFGNAYIGDTEEAALRAYFESKYNQNFTNDLYLVRAGQSNESRKDSVGGVEVYGDVLQKRASASNTAGYYGVFSASPAALGGAGLTQVANGTNYYWNSVTQEPGPVHTSYVVPAVAGVERVDWFIWRQGETGSLSEDYATELDNYFTYLKTLPKFENTKFAIEPLAIRSDGLSTDEIFQATRDAHAYVAANRADTYLLPETYGQELTDGLHHTLAGYQAIVGNNARYIAGVEGKITIQNPPSITGAAGSNGSADITVTISHGAGTDFTPTTGIEGFYVTVDGTPATISSAARASATTITVTLSSPLSTGQTVLLWYGYGKMASVDRTKIVTDNASNPLALRAASQVAVSGL